MPLDHGYGVVIGTKERYYRDPVNHYGQYYHGNVEVRAPAGIYRCAIDVDSKNLPNGVQWRVVSLSRQALKGVADLADGWHDLVSTPDSGALDYIRNRDLRPRTGCALGPLGDLVRFVVAPTIEVPWSEGTSIDALADLEPLLANPKRIMIFGEPFHDGTLGVHNIHQNQGDPLGSSWSDENGIWQDGGTIVETQEGDFVAFLNKFKTQSDRTDDFGRPV